APARICKVPVCCVLSLSPTKTVAPTVADAAPTWAPNADVTVPTAGADAPIAVERTKRTESTTQNKARRRAIGPPSGPKKEYSLAPTTSIGKRACKKSVPIQHYFMPGRYWGLFYACSSPPLRPALFLSLAGALPPVTATMPHTISRWPTGNKSQLAFAAQRAAKIRLASSAIFFRKLAT